MIHPDYTYVYSRCDACLLETVVRVLSGPPLDKGPRRRLCEDCSEEEERMAPLTP